MENSDEEDEDWTCPLQYDSPPKGDNSLSTKSHDLVHDVKDDATFTSKLSHNRTIIHIDMDCFYAQVEMIRNPALRTKPLGIQQKYIIVTCNYVARERGVTKLSTIKDAKEKCPELILVCGEDLTHYREYSYKISEFFQQYTPNVERLGFDENFLDVSEMVKQRLSNQDLKTEVKGHIYGEGSESEKKCSCGCHERLVIGSQIAADIREALFMELGFTSCAGISYNKLLSKLIAGHHKPNQQTTLLPESVRHFLGQIDKAGKIPGIGHATAKKLSAAGITSVLDIRNTDLCDLQEVVNPSLAVTIKQLCLGLDESPVVTFGKPLTLSDEDSFRQCCTVEAVKLKIRQLLSSLTPRLMEDGRIAQTIRLAIRRLTAENKWTNRESRQCPIPPHLASSLATAKLDKVVAQLEDIVLNLFLKIVDTKNQFHITLMNIAFCNLIEKPKNSIASFLSPSKSSKSSVNSPSQLGNSSPHLSGMCTLIQDSVNQEDKLTTMCRGGKSKNIQHVEDEKSFKLTSENELSKEKQSCSSEYSNVISKDKKGFFKSVVVTGGNVVNSQEENREFDKQRTSTDTGVKRKLSEITLPMCSTSKRNKTNEAQRDIGDEIDEDVLSQLPQDIQEEVLQNYNLSKNQTPACQGDISTINKSHVEGPINKTGALKTQDSHVTICEPNPCGSLEQKPVNDSILPPNIDKDVFDNLPDDIKQEYLQQWTSKHPGKHSTKNTIVKTVARKPQSKMKGSNRINSIDKYFKK